MDDLNLRAAKWWAQWLPKDKRARFVAELFYRLPETDFRLYNDYDPDELLLEALHASDIECRGCMFSGADIGFPTKTGIARRDNVLYIKRGYGAIDVPLTDEHFQQDQPPRGD